MGWKRVLIEFERDGSRSLVYWLCVNVVLRGEFRRTN